MSAAEEFGEFLRLSALAKSVKFRGVSDRGWRRSRLQEDTCFERAKESDLQQGARVMKGQKSGRPRGKSCRWTPDLDEVLRSAWVRGGLRAARTAIREYQPTWTVYSMRRRAAALFLCKPKAALWSDGDVNSMLWAIDSNASLALIAERLGRSVGAVRHKLRALGYTVDSLGGYKVKDVADMFSVPIGRVRYWVAEKLLLTKGGRITDSSFSKFLADHPKKIPFDSLSKQMQSWLMEMGYPAPGPEAKAAKAAK